VSGAYVFQTTDPNVDLPDIGRLLSAQLTWRNETVNHYAVSKSTVLGAVSPDPLQNGAMPRYLERYRLWGALLGTLYESDFLSDWRARHDAAATALDIFGDLFHADALEDSLPRMNGAFFVILWDPAHDALVAANDRFGLYPMYWSRNRGRFCLASRALCSVLAGVCEGQWDLGGVAQVLTTNDFAGETTLIRGVSTFPQATLLVKRGTDEPAWHRYWHYDYQPRYSGVAPPELAEELGRRFVQSVRRQTVAGRRIGVTLSGGLDSRTIVAATAKAGVPVQTFTWGKKDAYDRRFARDIARRFGATHHDCEYQYERYERLFDVGMRITEGFVNALDMHMLAHLDILEGAVDVVLNGYAGDLVLGGSYLRRKWMGPVAEDDLADILFSKRTVLFPESELASAMQDHEAIEKEDMPSSAHRRLLRTIEGIATPDRVDRFFLENRVRRHTSMGTVLLRCAVESAASFFDYDLLDLITGIPAPLRREHRIYLTMMRQAFPESLQLRWQRTLLRAGAPEWQSVTAKAFLKGCRILKRRLGWPKFVVGQSPVDFAGWLRGPLREWMAGICDGPCPVADEALKPEFCRHIWQEHVAGKDRTLLLGAIAQLRGFARALEGARKRTPASSSAPEQLAQPIGRPENHE